jgi:ribosomal protein S18 acetylase RimI-like enzyme
LSDAIRVDQLRPRHRSDIETIVRATGVFSDEEIGVALELFDEAIAGSGNASEPAGNREPTAVNQDYEFLGAFAADRLVGYACFGPTPSTDRTFDLYWIAVHPDAQRTGAGAALMNEVERRLESLRARLLVVETSSREDYTHTRRFYHKRGYTENARLRDFHAPGDDRVILTRRLDAPPAPATAGQ